MFRVARAYPNMAYMTPENPIPVWSATASSAPEEITAEAVINKIYLARPMVGSRNFPKSLSHHILKRICQKSKWTNAEVISPQYAPDQIWMETGMKTGTKYLLIEAVSPTLT